ncbi:hypothetical protein [uncultured Chryseobacterium sp.]|uniref:hypothetical protein n=1 Tax=uncultured Chryseobacterium sp. TaxID=259322 RepID=UPI0025D68DA1|nr:hypothetical protein [uncultured Chryseobacterium sp.]
MGTNKYKSIVGIAAPLLGVIYFGYTWLSDSYNDHPNYDYRQNTIGQFAFFAFFVLLIFNTLKVIHKESFFVYLLIIFVFILTVYLLITKLFLYPFFIVIGISFILFYSRKWFS